MGIRLGRMKTPLGFYNDTLDVPFTRPSILLPHYQIPPPSQVGNRGGRGALIWRIPFRLRRRFLPGGRGKAAGAR